MKKKPSDAWIALSVIACSIVLFLALSFGLEGKVFVRESRMVRVRFPDITGIKVSSQVKFAGASAGTVSGIRILTAAEREKDRRNAIELTLHIAGTVPPLTAGAHVSVSADTLLSDKFVLIQNENPGAPLLAQGEFLQGTTPVTFDRLVRELDDTLVGLRNVLGGDASENAKDLISKMDRIAEDTQGLLTELKPVVKDANHMVGDAKLTMSEARSLLSDNKDRLQQAILQINRAAGSMDSLAKKGESLLQNNSRNLSDTLSGLRVSAENLKVTSTYSRILLRDLCERPTRLLWGRGSPPELPSQEEILQSRKPVPDP